jgi:GNAT superfamily N-acetyltransferase
VIVRPARAADVPAIARLLSQDVFDRRDPDPDDPAYLAAFEAIDADPDEHLVVADTGGEIAGTLQLTFLRSLSRGGALRAQLEAVRVRADRRGAGIGTELVGWAVAAARARGCTMVQLTTDKRRADAQRFYSRLGFRTSHEGLKLPL